MHSKSKKPLSDDNSDRREAGRKTSHPCGCKLQWFGLWGAYFFYTLSQLPDEEYIKLHTHFHVREDVQMLYGFKDTVERDIFRLLIGVSGIGTSTARTMLSSLPPDEIHAAIAGEDVDTIQSIKALGSKTAQRVIIDLKDKVKALPAGAKIQTVQNNT